MLKDEWGFILRALQIRIFFTLFLGLIGCLSPSQSWAVMEEENFFFSLGGGKFVPFDGHSGFVATGGLFLPVLSHVLVGGELEYRQFKTKFLGVRGVESKSVAFRAMAKFLLFQKGFTPYAGGGFSIALNIIDTEKIERERPGIEVFDKVGMGSGIFGLVGVLVPVNSNVSFFAEGRASFDIQLTHFEETEVENLGGFSGLGGVVFYFL